MKAYHLSMSHHLCAMMIAVAILFGYCTNSAAGQASDYTGIAVFGDSLSDTGNLFQSVGWPAPPYWQGRFSNGPIWIEELYTAFDIPAANIDNRAVGGFTTLVVFSNQLAPFIIDHAGSIPRDWLYVLWAGSNDLLPVLADPTLDSAALMQSALFNIGISLEELYLAGAQDVLLLTLPDTSLTPRGLAISLPEQAAVAQMIEDFNQQLLAQSQLLAKSTGMRIFFRNPVTLFEQINAEPASYGIVNWTNFAMDPLTLDVVPDPSGYVFWDDIHPTTLAHEHLAQFVLEGFRSRRGDVNLDQTVDIADAIALLGSLLVSSEVLPCADSADCNDDGTLDIFDALYLLAYLFNSGAAPPAPGPETAGLDPTADDLRCR